ncbi:MAG: hypothetical protein AAB281_02645 [Actinomycetota bacterium]
MKGNRATTIATIEVIFGVVIFTSAWWLSHDQHETALYIYGFVTVLMGIAIATLLTSKS